MFKMIIACVLLLVAGCATPPELEAVRSVAWDWHPYQEKPGDWSADPNGDCKNKALWIGEKLTAQGYAVTYLVGFRTDLYTGVRHMVPVASRGNGWYAIDADGVFALADYPWRNDTDFDIGERLGSRRR